MPRERRYGDKTSLTLDSYTVRQSQIEMQFCDKEMFFSLFNPLYFIERLGENGRDILSRLLPEISNDDVLSNLTESERKILQGKDFTDVLQEIKYIRNQASYYGKALNGIQGQIELLKAQAERITDDKLQAAHELHLLKKRQEDLSQRQFEGVDIAALQTRMDDLISELSVINSGGGHENIRIMLSALNDRRYISSYMQEISDTSAEITALTNQYNSLKTRIDTVKSGDQCPVCYVRITPQNIADFKSELKRELNEVMLKGKERVARRKELQAADASEKANFEKNIKYETEKLKSDLIHFEAKKESAGDINSELNGIEYTLKYGNLTKEEYDELCSIESKIAASKARSDTLNAHDYEGQISEKQTEYQKLEKFISESKCMISALGAFMTKRAELSIKSLDMPNVKIQLYDIVRSTGEVKDAFRFTYQGRNYRCLSLSEKVKAGLEVSALLRRLTGLDYPVFIDNAESIAELDSKLFPSQVILSKVVKGAELSVRGVPKTSDLKKAG